MNYKLIEVEGGYAEVKAVLLDITQANSRIFFIEEVRKGYWFIQCEDY